MQIVTIEMNLQVVNKEEAVFNCEKKVLDGGYVFGKFDCPHCAIEAINLLAVKITDGDKSVHGNYRQHKRTFMESAFITVH